MLGALTIQDTGQNHKQGRSVRISSVNDRRHADQQRFTGDPEPADRQALAKAADRTLPTAASGNHDAHGNRRV